MDTTTSSHEDLVCQTCGDKGFTNAYVYCVKCLKFVIHRYCLKVIPKTFDEFVDWVCEDCRQPLPCPVTSHKLNIVRPPKQNSPQVKTKKRSNKPKKKKKITRLVKDERVSPSICSLKDLPVLALEAPLKGEDKRKRDESFSGVKRDENKTRDSVDLSCCDSSCTDVDLKNKADIQEPESSAEKINHPTTQTAEAETANEVHNEQEMRVDRRGDEAQSNNAAQYIHYQPAQPYLDPVWRGSFDITKTHYNIFEGFVGHLSNKACKKVCHEANVLPSLLSLEMHPKAALWPKSFFESQPTDENIALYFFPGDTKNERGYEELVSDMIYEELAMKAPARNAELLIFTSRVLPRPFWRFQGKNYLWGVFRGKKRDLSVSNNSQLTNEKENLTEVKSFDSQSPQSPLCNYR